MCYPKDPMWNRVKYDNKDFEILHIHAHIIQCMTKISVRAKRSIFRVFSCLSLPVLCLYIVLNRVKAYQLG